MTNQEAAYILDPETTRKALAPYALDCQARMAVVNEACAAAAKALRETGWISVKDYLPEEGKIVMVHQIYSWERQEDGAAITIGRLRPSKEGEAMLWQFQHYRPDFRNWNCIDNDIICPGNEYVTHWKPLPQRPEDERYGTE